MKQMKTGSVPWFIYLFIYFRFCVVYYCPNTWSSDEIKSYGTDKNRPWEPRVVLGTNGRPLNSSHFRNSKWLEIDKVVSEKEREGKKDEKEGGREEMETIEEMLALEKAWLRSDKHIKKKCINFGSTHFIKGFLLVTRSWYHHERI